jgi:hypothetical protein
MDMTFSSTCQRGYGSLSLLFAAIIAFAGAFGIYLYNIQQAGKNYTEIPQNTTGMPLYPSITPVPTESLEFTTPDSVVRNFYSNYLLCVTDFVKTQSNKKVFDVCSLSQPNILSQTLHTKLSKIQNTDPIMCTTNVPREIHTSHAIVSGDTAIVGVRFDESDSDTAYVSLSLSADGWHMSDIRCQN